MLYRRLANCGVLPQGQRVRCMATTSSSQISDVLFPSKSDFPSRHIGPRKTDVVTMLDTLGYKVDLQHELAFILF